VDKSKNALRIIVLAILKLAGQVLYRSGMFTGQQNACGETHGFCTSHPVDIQ
jgi:hypothetical protein